MREADVVTEPIGGLTPVMARPDNLTSMVFAAIRDRIVDSTLPPGSSVSEALLSKQLQVSKTPVREALLRLRHIGLVESTTRGLRVVRPSIAGIRDAFEFRGGIEAMAGRYAASRATTEQHDRIVEQATASLAAAKEGRRADFLSHDHEFHLEVARAARNEVLFQAVENSIVLTRALRWRDVHIDRDFVPDAHEHVVIADLIRAGSPDLASSKLAEHIHRIMLTILDVYPSDAAADEDGSGR